MSVRQFASFVSGLLLLAGLGCLALPISASSDGNDSVIGTTQASCGNGYMLSVPAWSGRTIDQACQSAATVRRAWTIPLAVLGLVGLVGTLTVNRKIEPLPPSAPVKTA